jgi:lipopolysaccharide transport system permease protein
MPLDYTTYLLAGLVPWLTFQDAMVKTCSSITGNIGLVKQVIFPLEILPSKGVLASLVTQLISLLALLVYVLATQDHIFLTYLILPFLLGIQLLTMLGVGFFLSSVGAYFKDMKDLVQLFALASMYLMPVFYLPDMVPRLFMPILYVNPFSHLIWCYQDALYFGRFAHPWSWMISSAFSIFAFAGGYRVFRKLKVNFGNVV